MSRPLYSKFMNEIFKVRCSYQLLGSKFIASCRCLFDYWRLIITELPCLTTGILLYTSCTLQHDPYRLLVAWCFVTKLTLRVKVRDNDPFIKQPKFTIRSFSWTWVGNPFCWCTRNSERCSTACKRNV